MKKMNLLFIGGRTSGKSTFLLQVVQEALSNVPDWLNLKITLQNAAAPNAFQMNRKSFSKQIPPIPMHEPGENRVCTLRVRKKRIFWFSVVMDVFRKLFLWRPMGEIGGIQLNLYELSIENPRLGEWLLNHSDQKTPLGVVLTADPFALGKTCDSHREPAVGAVVEKLVERFEQIYVGNPEKRLPVPVALVVTHSEKFSQFQTAMRQFINANALGEMHRAAGDMDGMIPDSSLLNHLCSRQSAEARGLLERYDGNFVHILQNAFQDVSYFWSGLYTHPETGNGFLWMGSPLLPLLWLVSEQYEF